MERAASEEGQARVEQLLREAHVYRMRGQTGAAETLCRQAMELAPEDMIGRELLGDLLVEKGQVDEALELYRKAFEAQPQKASLEEKIARAVLKKDEEERERITAQLMVSSPVSRAERKRHATVTLLLSMMCPGLGQIVMGQTVKGAILLAIGVLSLYIGFEDLFKMFLGLGGALPRGEEVDSIKAALGLVGILIYLYSLLDASAQAARGQKSPVD
jgi:tetratricopeptide (TPR) repeat protein